MKCPKEIVRMMHNVLDEEATREEQLTVQNHLKTCSDCKEHYEELKRTESFLLSSPSLKAPDGFTSKVMQQLPQEKKTVWIKRWMKSHPLMTAAVLFLVLMAGSVYSSWTSEDQMTALSGNLTFDQETNTVIVPEGEVIKGDLTVKNRNLEIEGKVEGDVLVINGEQYMASAGQVTGDIEEVDHILDWTWYHLRNVFIDIGDVFSSDK
ncbi:anti-sigma factor family protein [Guptibacillus algicola]|uniref:anti-sigma factor family protein n=1 Tax=Guptibacillus algicola TaxID=225844 RepID=UPI001CD1D8F0|nr:anti-sigma factor [Alkalihalobacillus algicola]MCA0989533.1 anti-sigma factor [Alkalihalobacillus algicola]